MIRDRLELADIIAGPQDRIGNGKEDIDTNIGLHYI